MLKKNISVVVPVFNSEQYIIGCLNSIIKQTYLPYEIIIVSDGCIDRSIELACSFLDATDIKYQVIEQRNQGVASARNNGISHATGEWIIAIDSDDQIYPQTFEVLMNSVSDEDVLAVGYKSNQRVDEEPHIEKGDVISIDGKLAVEKYYRREYGFIAPALILKKSFLVNNEIIYDEGCRFAEDDIYVWKVLCTANKILYVKKPLYNYIMHSGSTMTTSKLSKFLSVKQTSEKLDQEYILQSENTRELKYCILYRHFMGLIHAAAKVQTFKEFVELIDFYGMKKLYAERKKHFDLKSRILFQTPFICPHLLYYVFRI